MRRSLSLVAAAVAGLLAAGCSTSSDHGEENSPRKDPTKQQSKPHQDEGSALDLPSGAKVLVPEQSGAKTGTLRKFKPAADVYTVYARCEGPGKVSIVHRDDEKSEPRPIACDGVMTVGQVHTEIETQQLGIEVAGGAARWSIAVVSGAHDV